LITFCAQPRSGSGSHRPQARRRAAQFARAGTELAANATTVLIAGTIVPGSEGAGTPPTVDGPLLRSECTGATEIYLGGLSSTEEAVYSLSGTFNTRSGATITRATETFTGCFAGACGTLEWRWYVTFGTDPNTVTVLRGRVRHASRRERARCREPKAR
jgi:hypothetical protein